MNSIKKEEFYSCLIELEHILDDLMTLNYEFQEASYTIMSSDSEIKFKRYDRLKDILYDLIVLRLYQLFEIHSLLGRFLKHYNKKLILTLKPQWKIIDAEKKIITKWRNELIAHSGSRAKDFQLYNEVDSDYFINIEKILKTSRFAVIYLWSVRASLFSEYEKAWKIKDRKMFNLKHFEISELLAKLILSEKQYFEETNKLLLANNLKTNIFCGYDDYPISHITENKSHSTSS